MDFILHLPHHLEVNHFHLCHLHQISTLFYSLSFIHCFLFFSTSTTEDKASSIVVPETRPAKSRSKSNTGGEKKKTTTPRSNKKKAAVPTVPTDLSIPAESEPMVVAPSIETTTPQVATTPESIFSSTKRQMSGTESEDFDEQQQSQTTNGKSGNESDGSIGDGDRSLNTVPSTSSSTAPEKKGARTTIKPQQLEVKSFH
jgi:hypothetical protein